MTVLDIVRHRLYNQRIVQPEFNSPGEAVSWLGAMQAQDFANAKWAVGLRCNGVTEASIEQAIVAKSILRTWLLRGTLHLTAPKDVRWMLALLSPRLIARGARRDRQLELEEGTYTRSFEVLASLLQSKKQMTRAEIMLALEQAGISPKGQRGYHILARAALEGLICFGPVDNKQQTFVLLDEWAPAGKQLHHDEALAELARRYFTSHGPATLQDFTWWSGLAAGEARAGLEMIKAELRQEIVDGQAFWLLQNQAIPQDPSPGIYLLPGFDEYFLGYAERTAILDPQYNQRLVSANGVFRPIVVLDGQVVGTWKRQPKKGPVIVKTALFKALSEAERQTLVDAAHRYGAFLGLPVVSD